jgi:3-hydroxyacyl-CoA dehydrogenase
MDRGVPQPQNGQGAVSTIRHAGVIGAGQMGAGIAGMLVRAGISTTLVDVNPAMLDEGARRALQIASKTRPGSDTPQSDGIPALGTSTELSLLVQSEVVIEAVTEDEAKKTSIFRALANVLDAGAIVASNTSTIPISRMARSSPRPERFAGMHFFHPAHRMELVEVIRGEQSSDETIASLVALARQLEKKPIVVQDGPGFLTTRVLCPYLNEAIELVQEGAPMDAIDDAAVRFGMATGPIALLDFVGLDTALAIARVMASAFPDRFAVNPLLVELVRIGRLGRKSGAGFRMYEQPGSSVVPDPAFQSILEPHRKLGEPPAEQAVTERLFLSMLLESIRVVEDEIVRDPADVDLSVVLGLGFPVARGGILKWCDHEGAGAVLRRLTRYRPLGDAFDPPAMLRQMATTGNAFHGR